jgi:Retroviral aspartyl protease
LLKRRTVSTSVSPYLDVYSVTIANISQNSISIPIKIGSNKQTVKTLIDSGAGRLFIDQNYAKNFNINYLDKPVKAYNVDGTENKQGTINAYVNLEFSLGERKFKEQFYVTGLGKQKIILGFPWLDKYNSIIDWKKGEVTFKPFKIDWRCLMEKGKQIRQEQQPKIEEVVDDEEQNNRTTLPIVEDKLGVYIELLETDVWIHKTNIATELAIEENSKKQDKTDKQLVPAEYHEYLDIFSEEKAHRFPELRPWDHKIEMKEGFEPKSFKNYNLTPAEQLELDKFLKENLKKGYIQPSQSPMASPFFFASKKDGKL